MIVTEKKAMYLLFCKLCKYTVYERKEILTVRGTSSYMVRTLLLYYCSDSNKRMNF